MTERKNQPTHRINVPLVKRRVLMLGLTQKELSRRMGFRENYVNMVINGHRPPGPRFIAAISDVLHISGEEILVFEGETVDSSEEIASRQAG